MNTVLADPAQVFGSIPHGIQPIVVLAYLTHRFPSDEKVSHPSLTERISTNRGECAKKQMYNGLYP
jgi:hypothetical protein